MYYKLSMYFGQLLQMSTNICHPPTPPNKRRQKYISGSASGIQEGPFRLSPKQGCCAPGRAVLSLWGRAVGRTTLVVSLCSGSPFLQQSLPYRAPSLQDFYSFCLVELEAGSFGLKNVSCAIIILQCQESRIGNIPA